MSLFILSIIHLYVTQGLQDYRERGVSRGLL
jgi:hypothetical protein